MRNYLNFDSLMTLKTENFDLNDQKNQNYDRKNENVYLKNQKSIDNVIINQSKIEIIIINNKENGNNDLMGSDGRFVDGRGLLGRRQGFA